ncbi:hypothetical protein WA026_001995 [Henosepilachna vigintioctopunctata]|uniref:Reverse transcriptase domain-containing protein n=1 Tax=Henosepilachna vigintioctopunctata TaxID=420089 RepID=A0AAW1UVD5_9CUCU
MMNYLNKYSIISSFQHVFCSGKSTQTAVCQFLEFIYLSLDSGLHVAGMFFNQSRAFDCLQFPFIQSKMYSIGFRGVFLDWISSFLSLRHLFGENKNHRSENYPLSMGVPQGSALGHLIFSLFEK